MAYMKMDCIYLAYNWSKSECIDET